MIFDLSLLLPSYQKEFIETFLSELWVRRVTTKPRRWVLLVFEEFQLYGRNTRGMDSQNIMRIMSVSANHKIRVLGITPGLSLIDTAFIRSAQQRYYFKLSNELNAKRRFSRYYGSDYIYTARHLDVGQCLYVLREETPQICTIPLFVSTRRSEPYTEPEPKEREPRNFKERIFCALGNRYYEEDEEEDEQGLLFSLKDSEMIGRRRLMIPLLSQFHREISSPLRYLRFICKTPIDFSFHNVRYREHFLTSNISCGWDNVSRILTTEKGSNQAFQSRLSPKIDLKGTSTPLRALRVLCV